MMKFVLPLSLPWPLGIKGLFQLLLLGFVASCGGTGPSGETDGASVAAVPMLSISNLSATENSGQAAVSVSLSSSSESEVTVSYRTEGISANPQIDFVSTTGTLVFAPGSTQQKIVVQINDDNTAEQNEQFRITLSDAENANIDTDTATVTIVDNDNSAASSLPTISFDGAVADESDGSIVVTLSLSEPTSTEVIVDYATQDNEAIAGEDYVAATGQASFSAGAVATTIDIGLIDDLLDEANETFDILLQNPSGATLSPAASVGAAQIQDNDASPELSIANASIDEGTSGASILSFAVTLDRASGREIVVGYETQAITAVANVDFTPLTGTLRIPPGATDATIDVEILSDLVSESDETFFVNFDNPEFAVLSNTNAVGTILDDDRSGGVEVSISPTLVLNEGASGNVTITLSEAAPTALQVSYATSEGTATSDVDYQRIAGVAEFAAGQQQVQIAVNSIGDDMDEAEESFAVALSSPSSGLDIAAGTATINISDDDDAPTISIADGRFDEGANGSLVVSMSNPSSREVQFEFNTVAGTATPGDDYLFAAGQLTIPSGELMAAVEFTLLENGTREAEESFQIELSNLINATLSRGLATVVIVDNDDQPSVSVADVVVNEKDGVADFAVSLSQASDEFVSVEYQLSSGTAISGQDFVASSATLEFPPGSSQLLVSVSLIEDPAPEPDETFSLVLSDPTNASLADASGTATIIDTDEQVSLSVAAASGVEGDSGNAPMHFDVTLSSASTQTVTVTYATEAGTASPSQDFVATVGTLTFNPGTLQQSATVMIVGDLVSENAETFLLRLSDPQNAVLADSSAVGTIQDNEGSPSLVIADASTNEGTASGGSLTFQVSMAPASPAAVTVDYNLEPVTATVDADYTDTSGELTFAPNQVTASFSVPIAADAIDENNETLRARLSNANGADIADTTATGTIIDDDSPPQASVADVSVAEDGGVAVVVVTLNAASAKNASFDFQTSNGSATAGSDYVAQSQNMVIAAGALSNSISIPIVDDGISESTESFLVELDSPSNLSFADDRATVTITDNDSAVSLSIADAATTEGNSGSANLAVNVSLSAVSAQNVRVNYTTANGSAVAGSDFVSTSGTLTIDAGDLTDSIDVAILGDTTVEGTESFSVQLSSPVGATLTDGTAVVTISDNDSAAFGMDSRPTNNSCVAPARSTGGGGGFSLVDAFPNLPDIDQPMKMIQPQNDSSQWYALTREGGLDRFSNSTAASSLTRYLNISVSTEGEGGFLGAVFHPNWPATKEIFVSYYTTSGGKKTRLSRLIINNDSSLPASYTEQILMTVDQPYTNHNGGDLDIGPDGNLYWGLGDGGSAGDPQRNGQDTTTLLSSIVRIDAVGVSYPNPGYNIPASNPFSGNAKCGPADNAQACPEIYAYGFRNPWRMSFDQQNGDLWVGDVGQDSREEIDLVDGPGGNYGWRCFEGNLDKNKSGCDGISFEAPVHDYQHTSSSIGSVTGGYVYRGTAVPDLVGDYIYADYKSDQVWTLTKNGSSYTNTEIIDGNIAIASFSQGNDGEVYALAIRKGRVYKFQGSGGVVSDNVPDSLVDTGCVSTSNPQLPASGLVPYAPAAPFWSDGASKDRWIALPPGGTISAQADNDFAFPPGSVLMKNFSIGATLVETRLFMRHPDGDWAGYTYEWNAAQTSATRIDNGKTRSVNGQTWEYPSQAECDTCHTASAGYALGPEISQLNSNFAYPASGITDNQLEVFNHIGMFSVDVAEPVSQLPSLVDPTDAGADLTDRARAYLHTNCAGCHRAGGPTQVSLDFEYSTSLANTSACDAVPQEGSLGIADARIIAPGDPDRSVLLERMDRRDSNQMPPLGSRVVDTDGVSLIRSWIGAMGNCQ